MNIHLDTLDIHLFPQEQFEVPKLSPFTSVG